MDLNTSIEELKLALQNSDAFCRYQKIREEVHHYPEKEHRLHEFEENYFLPIEIVHFSLFDNEITTISKLKNNDPTVAWDRLLFLRKKQYTRQSHTPEIMLYPLRT